jgi:uncharacterized membrane protein YqjE
MSEEAGRKGGLLSSLRCLTSTLIEVLYTRVELFAVELDEERRRITRALWLAAMGAFCLGLGILLAVLFLVVLFWDTHRLLVLGILAFGFLAAGIAALLTFRARLADRTRLFSQTLEELRRDRDRLDS